MMVDLLCFLGASHCGGTRVVHQDVNVSKHAPSLLNLALDCGIPGRDVQVEDSNVVGSEVAESLLCFASGGDDLVTTLSNVLDEGSANARRGTGDEPNDGSHD